MHVLGLPSSQLLATKYIIILLMSSETNIIVPSGEASLDPASTEFNRKIIMIVSFFSEAIHLEPVLYSYQWNWNYRPTSKTSYICYQSKDNSVSSCPQFKIRSPYKVNEPCSFSKTIIDSENMGNSIKNKA
jgi:hypothetical protein